MKLLAWKPLSWAVLSLPLLGSVGCSGINANVPVSPAMFMLQNSASPPPNAVVDSDATPLLARAE